MADPRTGEGYFGCQNRPPKSEILIQIHKYLRSNNMFEGKTEINYVFATGKHESWLHY